MLSVSLSSRVSLALDRSLSSLQVIAAITNTVIGLNVITEFIAGYIWPGKPLANVAFKCVRTLPLSCLKIDLAHFAFDFDSTVT